MKVMNNALLALSCSLALSGIPSVFAQGSVGSGSPASPAQTTQQGQTAGSSNADSPQTDYMPGGFVFETWTVYFEEVDRNAISVYFDKGSANLSSLEKQRILDWATIVKDQNAAAPIVASWADKAYPSGKESLSKADRDLAEKRGQAVKDVLNQAGSKPAEVFNMADKPNWFQRVFATESARIKGEVKAKSWESKTDDMVAQILHRRGGPSKAVIMFKPTGKGTTVTGR